MTFNELVREGARSFQKHCLVLAFACFVSAQSQPPVQTPAKSSHDKQAIGDSKETHRADWWIITPTLVIAIATVAQACIYFRQTRLMATALSETKTAAEAAKESADASKRSADVAHDTFVSTHRPRLTLRFMAMDSNENLPSSISGRFLIFNTGESRAILNRYYTDVAVLKDLPPIPPYQGKHGEKATDVVILPGQSCPLAFPTAGPKPVDGMSEFKSIVRGMLGEPRHASVYVLGWIEYLDDAGRKRTMGFCREYDFETHRFQRVPDEDYEYED